MPFKRPCRRQGRFLRRNTMRIERGVKYFACLGEVVLSSSPDFRSRESGSATDVSPIRFCNDRRLVLTRSAGVAEVPSRRPSHPRVEGVSIMKIKSRSRGIGAGSGPVGLAAPESSSIDAERRYGAFNYEPLPVVMAHGEGVWLWDE